MFVAEKDVKVMKSEIVEQGAMVWKEIRDPITQIVGKTLHTLKAAANIVKEEKNMKRIVQLENQVSALQHAKDMPDIALYHLLKAPQ